MVQERGADGAVASEARAERCERRLEHEARVGGLLHEWSRRVRGSRLCGGWWRQRAEANAGVEAARRCDELQQLKPRKVLKEEQERHEHRLYGEDGEP